MAFLNPYSCPKCGAQFPLLFIKPSMRIRRGFLAPYLKCANCGQISRQKINFFRAIWIWPLTISAFAGITHILQSYLYCESPILYILIVWILLIPFFITLRHGFTLIPIEEKQKEQGENQQMAYSCQRYSNFHVIVWILHARLAQRYCGNNHRIRCIGNFLLLFSEQKRVNVLFLAHQQYRIPPSSCTLYFFNYQFYTRIQSIIFINIFILFVNKDKRKLIYTVCINRK